VAKQWIKSCKARFRGLGVDVKQAAIVALSRRGPWAMSNMKAFKLAQPYKFFADRGLLALSGYGPVRPVVWEGGVGGGREAATYSDWYILTFPSTPVRK